ncbi:MAG: O-succinylbenzoic acid--CoA ligase, partial [Myxococcota bacterium]
PVTSSAIARPDHPAVITDSATCSWRELDQASAREATVLGGLGLGAGDTIALWSERSAPFVATLHAIGRVGAAAAPLDKRRTGLIASMEAARATTLLCTDAGQSVPSGIDSIRMIDHPDLPAAADRFQPLNEVRLVVLTSGTTGTPRAIRLTTLQIMTSAFGSAIRLGHDPADRWLCCLPLHHVGGLSILLRSAFYGITTILGEAGDERATLMSLVPTQLQRLLDARGVVPFGPHLRAILLGGGPTSPALLARCEALSIPVSVTWGMTEAASQITTRAPGDTRPDAGAGTPLPFVRVQSVDGVLVARGPIVRGVLATRDRGRVDAEGRVHVGGRSDDAIISGGENIDPAAVEAVLDAHPDIAESAVVAIAHPEWGQRPAAVIVAAGDRQPTDEQLAAYCRERLSRYEVPDEFRWIDGLPRNALGKVVKHGLETC